MHSSNGFVLRLPPVIPGLVPLVEGALWNMKRRRDVIDYHHGRRVLLSANAGAHVGAMVRFYDDNRLRRLIMTTVSRRCPPIWVELPLDQILYKFRILLRCR